MTFTAAELAGLHAIMPGTKTVTYYSVSTAGAYPGSGTSVSGAEKRNLSTTMRAIQGVEASSRMIVWHLWAANLGSIVPKPNDKLVDDASVTWIVEDVTAELLGQRYRLMCKKGTA